MNRFLEHLNLSLEDALSRGIDENFTFESWTQLWPNTSCGFGGMSGQAITLAQTVIIHSNKGILVYHRGKYAYTVPESDCRLADWRKNKKFPGQKDAQERFEFV